MESHIESGIFLRLSALSLFFCHKIQGQERIFVCLYVDQPVAEKSIKI
jgi:hypothetical protein